MTLRTTPREVTLCYSEKIPLASRTGEHKVTLCYSEKIPLASRTGENQVALCYSEKIPLVSRRGENKVRLVDKIFAWVLPFFTRRLSKGEVTLDTVRRYLCAKRIRVQSEREKM